MKTSYKPLAGGVFFAICTLAIAACNSGGGGAVPQNTSDAPTTQSLASVAASPVHWQIQAGGSTLDQAFQDFDFYAHQITINVGDSVTWRIASREPHTVTFLAPGQTPPPPSAPGALAPAGGTTEDGTTYTSSGLLSVGGSYTLTFTKAGTYKFYCLLHQPEMAGTIVVQAAGSTYPHPQSFYTHQGSQDEWVDLNAAAASLAQFPYTPHGLHIAAGISPGSLSAPPADSTVNRFVDQRDNSNFTQIGNVSIHAGQTVTWTNLSNNAPHTITIPLPGQKPPPMSPFAPPSGGTTYDGTHLINSGPLFPGQSFSVTFTRAGGFYYYCLFHDDQGMAAAVHVDP